QVRAVQIAARLAGADEDVHRLAVPRVGPGPFRAVGGQSNRKGRGIARVFLRMVVSPSRGDGQFVGSFVCVRQRNAIEQMLSPHGLGKNLSLRWPQASNPKLSTQELAQ